jgi:NADH-quinone oxidoreductase subunit L
MIGALLWLVPGLPLLGAVVLGCCGRALPARVAGAIGAGSVGAAGLVAGMIAVSWWHQAPPGAVVTEPLWTWMSLPGFSSRIALYLDPVSLLMTLVITLVGFLIHLFSTEYMAGEEGYSRYFAYLNLFVAAMLLLVLATDLLVMFVGWEGVGVCSYLLVGFWYGDPANGYAAQKSFIVTRIADIAMLAGLLLLSLQLGTLEIQPMLAAAKADWVPGGMAPALAALLLLIGGWGKSAQAPLHTWLPDAMAGPTPVSALIHAATMVTAGVYLVVRLHPLFEMAPAVLDVIALGAMATLLIAACCALVQSDIKRVLAYSTMSQIGYMFLALGAGAWGAALFHFLTHAVFKALLFLSAGAITMRLHHEQNIFKMGGLRGELPIAFWSFLVGAASLAALPLVSAGFFSKEMVLGAAWARPGLGAVMWVAGITGAFLTAVYSFRAVFLVFLGPVTTQVSGSYGVRIWLPLCVLAAVALGIGWLETPVFLGGAQIFAAMLAPVLGAGVVERLPLLVPVAGMVVPVAGVVVSYGLYRSGFWHAQAVRPAGVLRRFLGSGMGFDALFEVTLVRPYLWLVAVLRRDPVDRLFNVLRDVAMAAHRRLRAGQGGKLRRYAAWLVAGSAAAVLCVVFA